MRSDRTGAMSKAPLWIWLVGLLSMVEFSGCSAKTGQDEVTKYNQAPLTVSIPSQLSPQQIEDAMVRTLVGRKWQVERQSPQEVVGTLNHRSYQAKAILKVDNGVIKILNESTYNGKPAVPPERWLEYLQQDLNRHFGQPT